MTKLPTSKAIATIGGLTQKPQLAETDSPSAFNIIKPCCLIFFAALMSRSWLAPQCSHCHCLVDNGNPSIFSWQIQHILELAYHLSIFLKCLPASLALYSSLLSKLPQDTSAICLDSLRFFSIFFTFRVSTIIAWFSSTIVLLSLCWKSLRVLASFS